MRTIRHLRLLNLLIILGLVLTLHYFVAPVFHIPSDLNHRDIFYLAVSLVAIAGGGYVINDYFDRRIDSINHRQQSASPAVLIRLYLITLLGGLSAALYLSYRRQDMRIFISLFLLAGVLVLYAVYVKKLLWFKNLLVALVLVFPFYYWFQAEAWSLNQLWKTHRIFICVIGYLISLTFVLNFLREVVKDLEDMPGDREGGVRSLPLVFGVKFTRRLLLFITWFLIPVPAFLSVYVWEIQRNYALAQAVVVPVLLYLAYRIYRLSRDKHFTAISRYIKYLLAFGIISLFLLHGR